MSYHPRNIGIETSSTLVKKERKFLIFGKIHTHVSIQYLKNETFGNIKKIFTFDSQIEEDFKVCVSRRSQSPLSHYQVNSY